MESLEMNFLNEGLAHRGAFGVDVKILAIRTKRRAIDLTRAHGI